MAANSWLIVGLGNPGKKYELNWHNLGFLVLEQIARDYNLGFRKLRFKSRYDEIFERGQKLHLIFPGTYMNLSGEAVREALSFYQIDTTRLIVILDDKDLELGQLRLRKSGSAGSHNGLKSIITCLGTENFIRLRLGMGPIPPRYALRDYVMSDIPQDKLDLARDMVERAAEACLMTVFSGLNEAMQKHNGKISAD